MCRQFDQHLADLFMAVNVGFTCWRHISGLRCGSKYEWQWQWVGMYNKVGDEQNKNKAKKTNEISRAF